MLYIEYYTIVLIAKTNFMEYFWNDQKSKENFSETKIKCWYI